ncbi:hypothetical protein [Rivularia sp. UHCC 0363]|uniref:hypothetical protein n=1 Tax=Rivularia sp. UHCC 0363 TaxID=3110244 RepID=UPI002B1F2AF8|nr:hypothetical protein [Rivularia sp. UHCC 0363]MEA5592772.1 hypothetical protein [Rivularia sp. UHCC 0363]
MSQKNQNIPPSSPKNPPFWKASLIKALRATIGLLETTAVKLEIESLPGSEEKPGFLQKLQQGWNGILAKIRLILPAQFSAKLSNSALTGIIGGLAVIIFLITTNIDRTPQVAIAPPDTESPAVVSTTNPQPEETAPLPSPQENPSVVEQIPQPEQTASLPPEEENPPIVEQIPQPEQTAPLPPEEENPPIVEQIPQPELETTSTPQTPEETLIAAIQNQIAEISNRTFSGIIQSIQANFLGSNLTIKVSNDWYILDKTQQDKLAAQIFQRSQELDFSHLEITDLQNKLLARNPVVGTEMIIFKRK